jgi:hypothetical protein
VRSQPDLFTGLTQQVYTMAHPSIVSCSCLSTARCVTLRGSLQTPCPGQLLLPACPEHASSLL